MHPSLSLPTLSASDASAIVHEPVYSVTPIGQGIRSRVYRVETEEGAVRVVRLTPRGSGRVPREAWVRAQLRRHPDVPTLAEVVVQGIPLAQQVDVVSMAELQGTTMFAATRTMFEPEVRTLYTQFGAGLAAIHQVPVQGFGLIDGGGRGPYPNWRAAFDALANASLEEARISPLAPLLPAASEALQRLAPALDDAQPSRLVHGDAQPMNVQVHRGRIVAFLDFEFASGADPAYELAYLEPLFEPAPGDAVSAEDLAARRAAFYEGYTRDRALPEIPAERMRLYRLVHALRGTEFLSVVGPQLAAPVREGAVRSMREQLERWLGS
jgi:aminoglycoside phosphotransferase (APT) family kinase protein